MRLAVSICQTFGDTMNYLNGQCRGTTKLRDNVPTSRLRTRSAITTTTITNSGSKVSTIHPSISMTTGDQCPLSNYYLWVQWTSTYHLEGLNVNIHTSTFDERVGVKREKQWQLVRWHRSKLSDHRSYMTNLATQTEKYGTQRPI